MRSAGNFHPEWGYLAPAPSFMRTVRIVLVATAIGATAGAAVVVSLVERPSAEADTTSIAAHALVTAVPVVTAPAPSVAIGIAAPGQVAATAPAPSGVVASATKPAASPGAPAKVAVMDQPAPAGVAPVPAESQPVDPQSADGADSVDGSEANAAQKPIGKKHRSASEEAARRWQAESDARKHWRSNRGFEPLFRLFSFRTGSSDYSN